MFFTHNELQYRVSVSGVKGRSQPHDGRFWDYSLSYLRCFLRFFPGGIIRSHSRCRNGVKDRVGLAAVISESKPCVNPFDQTFSQLVIRDGKRAASPP
ncbi:MAG: hypothetical protein LBQ54_11420, partial [Planctomycetaceae bacterium]|nr:hypothetical protein [Planctomycetaceae bacterium]